MWDFIQDEIFGMKWLNGLIGSLLSACGLDTESMLGGSLQFFIYDMIKIMVLLGVLIFVITYIQSYFPPERTKKILGRFHGIGAVIHNWIPEEWVVKVLGTGNPFGVIIAAICGIPMYADIFGCIPIAEALVAKAAKPVISFMITQSRQSRVWKSRSSISPIYRRSWSTVLCQCLRS